MAKKLNWEKVNRENLIREHGSERVGFDVTSAPREKDERTFFDMAEGNPHLGKVLREIQRRMYDKKKTTPASAERANETH